MANRQMLAECFQRAVTAKRVGEVDTALSGFLFDDVRHDFSRFESMPQ